MFTIRDFSVISPPRCTALEHARTLDAHVPRRPGLGPLAAFRTAVEPRHVRHEYRFVQMVDVHARVVAADAVRAISLQLFSRKLRSVIGETGWRPLMSTLPLESPRWIRSSTRRQNNKATLSGKTGWPGCAFSLEGERVELACRSNSGGLRRFPDLGADFLDPHATTLPVSGLD